MKIEPITIKNRKVFLKPVTKRNTIIIPKKGKGSFKRDKKVNNVAG